MGAVPTVCPETPNERIRDPAAAFVPLRVTGKPSKPGLPKRRKGPPPDVLRKSGAHKDRKRQTGREPVRRDDIDDAEKRRS